MRGRLDDVLQGAHVRPQVEMLEHHRQARAHALQLAGVGGLQRAVAAGHQLQLLAVEQDLAGVRLFQQVDAAQEGALAGTARADDADHVARFRCQRDALEHLVATVALVQVLDFQFVHVCVLG